MATLAELVRQHTELSKEDASHLQQLVGEWGMLADLCFADLVLYLRDTEGHWLVGAQVRPATGQTIHRSDLVDTPASAEESALLESTFTAQRISEAELDKVGIDDSVHVLAIPVRGEHGPVAVLTREWSSKTSRQPGELERTYLSIFQRFAEMIAGGAFPFAGRAADLSAAPRVGDGAIVLDDEM